MSTAEEVLTRLKAGDLTLQLVYLDYGKASDVNEIIDCLLDNHNVVRNVYFCRSKLTDETGARLARYIASSSTLWSMNLFDNQFTEATLLHIAGALRVNATLRWLYIDKNMVVDRTRVDAAFIEALRLNPHRYEGSVWWLYGAHEEYTRLQTFATHLGAPSMLSQLDTYETWMEQ